VIPTFIRQIQRGGPVTVTDPDVTRYFMSIPEAVGLVLQAAALSEGGEVFMLDMGKPVRIAELAERMIRMSGSSVSINFTGLRPGEKLTEELNSPDEVVLPTAHPSVKLVRPVAINAARLARGVDELATYAAEHDEAAAREAIFRLVRTDQGSSIDEGVGAGAVGDPVEVEVG
jgi:FlaA1/EpsC-like NDP-sugar epimerase